MWQNPQQQPQQPRHEGRSGGGGPTTSATMPLPAPVSASQHFEAGALSSNDTQPSFELLTPRLQTALRELRAHRFADALTKTVFVESITDIHDLSEDDWRALSMPGPLRKNLVRAASLASPVNRYGDVIKPAAADQQLPSQSRGAGPPPLHNSESGLSKSRSSMSLQRQSMQGSVSHASLATNGTLLPARFDGTPWGVHSASASSLPLHGLYSPLDETGDTDGVTFVSTVDWEVQAREEDHQARMDTRLAGRFRNASAKSFFTAKSAARKASVRGVDVEGRTTNRSATSAAKPSIITNVIVSHERSRVAAWVQDQREGTEHFVGLPGDSGVRRSGASAKAKPNPLSMRRSHNGSAARLPVSQRQQILCGPLALPLQTRDETGSHLASLPILSGEIPGDPFGVSQGSRTGPQLRRLTFIHDSYQKRLCMLRSLTTIVNWPLVVSATSRGMASMLLSSLHGGGISSLPTGKLI
jgi:hypothetical protein